MKFINNFTTTLFLCLSMISGPAQATVTSQPSQTTLNLVDQFVARMKEQRKAQPFYNRGRGLYINEAVVSQITTLEPEDFNLLVLYLMNRYVNNADDRPELFLLTYTLAEALKDDLEYTRTLNEGPQAMMVEGSYKIGALLFIGGAVLYDVAIKKDFFGAASLLQKLKQTEVALSQTNRLYGLSYRFATHPYTWIGAASTALGAGAGFAWQNYLVGKTHRIDPILILKILQANLACHLSYQGLAIQETFESLKDKPDELKKQRETLVKKISDLRSETQELMTEWPRLQDDLDVSEDFIFREMLSEYPKAQSWQKFRESLTEAEKSKSGQCRQMALQALISELERTEGSIDDIAPPPPPSVEAQEKLTDGKAK